MRVAINGDYKNKVLHVDLTQLPVDCSQLIVQLPSGGVLNQPVGVQTDHETAETSQTGLSPNDLSDLLPEFFRYLQLTSRKMSTGISTKDYQSRVGKFVNWLTDRQVTEITQKHWEDFYPEMKNNRASSTDEHYYRNLNRFANWLVETGRMSANPLSTAAPPRKTDSRTIEEKAIPLSVIQAMIDHTSNPRDLAFLVYMVDTGLRAAEAENICWQNINFETGDVTIIGKGGNKDKVHLVETTMTLLQNYRATLKADQTQPDQPVWWGERGPLKYTGFRGILVNAADRAGVDLKWGLHGMRHGFGMYTTEQGLDMTHLQRLLRHKSIETTQIYAHASDKSVKKMHHKFSPVNDLKIDLQIGKNGL